jgi:glycosyltransferase involved in cell wall biosynthesis
VVVAFPDVRPRSAANLLFYLGGPALAVALTAGGRGAVVCQSPYEALPAVLLAGLLPRSIRPPVVVEVHGDWRASSRLYGGPVRRAAAPLADLAAAWALRRADRVRVVSTWLLEPVRRAGFTGRPDVYPTFTDFAAFLDRSPVAPPARPAAAYVGVLEGPKGVDVLLEAWRDVAAAVPGAHLDIAGEGALGETLRRRARSLDGTVAFLGALPTNGVADLMDRSSLVVVPSRSEGLPRVVVEALARARPVVASSVGGIPDLIEDGRTGILVRADDPRALAAALARLLGDPEAAAAMGEEARRWAEAARPLERYEDGVRRLADWIASR